MVVPRYSTAGLVGIHVVRQLISCAWFYLFLSLIGTNPLERGPGYVLAMVIAFQIFGLDRLIFDLKADKELRQALRGNGNLEDLDRKWIARYVRVSRVYAVLGFIVGVLIVLGVVDFLDYDVPKWVGAPVIVLAVVLFVFARRLANPRSVKSLTKHVLPPGFKASE